MLWSQDNITIQNPYHKYMLCRMVELQIERYLAREENRREKTEWPLIWGRVAGIVSMYISMSAKLRGIQETEIGGSFPRSVITDEYFEGTLT